MYTYIHTTDARSRASGIMASRAGVCKYLGLFCIDICLFCVYLQVSFAENHGQVRADIRASFVSE